VKGAGGGGLGSKTRTLVARIVRIHAVADIASRLLSTAGLAGLFFPSEKLSEGASAQGATTSIDTNIPTPLPLSPNLTMAN
jgi:hypothetical protein